MAFVQPETPRSAAIKVAVTLALVIATQVMIFKHELGWPLGGFCLACALAVAATQRGVLRGPALAAWSIALFMGLTLVERPAPMALLLFWMSLSAAALLAESDGFDDVFRWAQRGAAHAVIAAFGPLIDLIQWLTQLPAGAVRRWTGRAPILVLPFVGGVLFLALFAAANPVLGQFFARLHLPPFKFEYVARTIFAGFVIVVAWGFLRPRLMPALIGLSEKPPIKLSAGTLILSLCVFNAVFALQNGLDLAFLWSGASLPAGVTFAEYAHRGAYILILTAVLAGAFSILALHPGSPGAASPWVRRLLVLWTLQTLLLVASSSLRLADYVEAYGLTRLRIAAWIWMAVVAAGLVLICWRTLRARSTAWLLNANTLVAGIALAGASVFDYGAIAAAWNVRHPPAAGAVDLCYLKELGGQALVSVVELERATADPVQRDAAATLRQGILRNFEHTQSDPYSWTWRSARRLSRALEINGGPFAPPQVQRDCKGQPLPIAHF
jgi:hypothetical protein